LNKSLFQTRLQMCAPFDSSSYITFITNEMDIDQAGCER